MINFRFVADPARSTSNYDPNFYSYMSCCIILAIACQGKRGSKGSPEPILADPLITVLIGELDVLVSAVLRYASVIQRYYIEYLKGAHLNALRKLIQVFHISLII